MPNRLVSLHTITGNGSSLISSLRQSPEFLPVYICLGSESWTSLYPESFESIRMGRLLALTRRLSSAIHDPLIVTICERTRYFIYEIYIAGSRVDQYADNPKKLPRDVGNQQDYNGNIERLKPFLVKSGSTKEARIALIERAPLDEAAIEERRRSREITERGWDSQWKKWREKYSGQDKEESREVGYNIEEMRIIRRNKPLIRPEDYLVAFARLVGINWKQAVCSYSVFLSGEASQVLPELTIDHVKK